VAVKAIVFDIGGVLEETPDLGLEAGWAARWGLDPAELDRRLEDIWYDGSMGAITLQEVHERIAAALGLPDEEVEGFMADIWREYLGTLNVELAEYLRGLRGRHRTAIISNSFVGAREKEEESYRFSELTEFIVYSHEVGLSKPDPRIFEMTLERLGCAPDEVVFLDDAATCVEGAREVGMHAILFQENSQAIAEIEALLAAA
jgi:epoxide hydrolase-like predicted phosphatase